MTFYNLTTTCHGRFIDPILSVRELKLKLVDIKEIVKSVMTKQVWEIEGRLEVKLL